MMNLMHLHTFVKVAELQSFSASADCLNMSKGMVSRHIRALEEALQCQLFYRTTRSVTLTEAGKELFDKAQQIERLAMQAQANIHTLIQEDAGTLKFTAPNALGRMICQELLPSYVKQYPKVHLSLDFNRQFNDVEFGQFDIALRASDELPDNLIAKDFGVIKNILVASPQFLDNLPFVTDLKGLPDNKNSSVNKLNHISDLETLATISDNYRKSWNTWQLQTDTLNQKGTSVTIHTESALSCSDYSDTLLMAKLGFGVANLPQYVVEADINHGHLVQVLPQWYSGIHHLYLVYTKQRRYPKKLMRFIELIQQWRNEHDEWFLV